MGCTIFHILWHPDLDSGAPSGVLVEPDLKLFGMLKICGCYPDCRYALFWGGDVQSTGRGHAVGPNNPLSQLKNRWPRFRMVHHCGEAAPNVNPLGHGRIIPRDGGGLVTAIMGGLGR